MQSPSAGPRAASPLAGQSYAWLATALIATSFPVGEAISPGLDPLILTFLRFVLAAIVIGVFVAARYGLRWPGWPALGRYVLISLVMSGFFIAMFEALRHTTALNTGTLFVLTPAITALYCIFLFGERPRGRTLLALAFGFIGAVWVIFRGDPARLLALEINYGDGIFLLGCLMVAAYAPLVRKFHRGEPAPVIAFWTLACASGWLVLFANTRLLHIEWAAIGTEVYVGIAYLAIFSTVISTTLYQAAALMIGPQRLSAYVYLNPARVVVMDWAIGKGLPPLMTLPGVLIVLAATVVLQLRHPAPVSQAAI